MIKMAGARRPVLLEVWVSERVLGNRRMVNGHIQPLPCASQLSLDSDAALGVRREIGGWASPSHFPAHACRHPAQPLEMRCGDRQVINTFAPCILSQPKAAISHIRHLS
jgi:hypothetical protein